MSTASQAAVPASASSADAVRIVLFGLPAAGKTSLLGALSQAARVQPQLLNGQLSDPAQALEQLRLNVNENRDQFPSNGLQFIPLRYRVQGGDQELNAVLIDCDGGAAHDLLRARSPAGAFWSEGSLAQAVLGADALILVVDASAPPERFEADFAEFGRFLAALEQYRGERIDISGLPVFLVLTKCDLLARPGDSPITWLERIEQHKTEVHQAFENFLRREPSTAGAPFGRIQLHLWATAVRRPALVGATVPASGKPVPQRPRPAGAAPSADLESERPREPYGVAELFRQALQHAYTFHGHQQRARRVLLGTVIGASGLIATLLALIVTFISMKPPHPLHDRLPPLQPDAAVRLAGNVAALKERLRVLNMLRNNRDFASLPQRDQERVDDLAAELEQYLQLYESLTALLAPGHTPNRKEVANIKMPDDREQEWAGTDLVLSRNALLAALDDKNADKQLPLGWYQELQAHARAQLDQAPPTGSIKEWTDWHKQMEKVLNEDKKRPFEEDQLLVNSHLVTCGMLLRFREVAELIKNWEKWQQPRLRLLSDISTALGLNRTRETQPLDIPPPAAAVIFKPSDWEDRLKQLGQLYPNFKKDFTLDGLPEKSREGIRLIARSRYEAAVAVGQEVVLQQYLHNPGDEKTRWEKLRGWLDQHPNELDSWSEIADVLLRLHKLDAKGPIADLKDFLGQKSFTINLTSLTLEIPEFPEIIPDRTIRVYYPDRQRKPPYCTLNQPKPDNSGDKSGSGAYRFVADKPVTITYVPGEHISASLSFTEIAAPDKKMMFTWAAAKSRGQSLVYQYPSVFLEVPPLRHAENEDYTAGEPAPKVKLRITEGECRPLPDLFPNDLNRR